MKPSQVSSNPLAPLLASLHARANPQKAVEMKAYMRGQFEFLGLPTPLRRSLSADFIRSKAPAAKLLALARTLWKEPERECQYVAVDLLARQWKTLAPGDIPALLSLARQRSWWDSVDGLAGVIGDIVKAAKLRGGADGEFALNQMDEALRHDNLWVRRIAMLHQLGWREQTDEQRLFASALQLAAEEDFFIRKAIGWALRDHARHAPDAVRHFLSGHKNLLSSLSIREAGKHL